MLLAVLYCPPPPQYAILNVNYFPLISYVFAVLPPVSLNVLIKRVSTPTYICVYCNYFIMVLSCSEVGLPTIVIIIPCFHCRLIDECQISRQTMIILCKRFP